MRSSGLLVKRLIDIIGASLALAVLSPIMIAIGLLIWLEDRGPALYIQTRVGRDAATFRCLKFRTMVVGAENMGAGIEVEKDDERITRVGRLLRRLRLDELPQLINVLKGEMSLVGPRPTVPSQTDRYSALERRRLNAKPGVTGWAAVKGGNALSWDERIRLDIWYIENWSVWIDLCVLLRTPYVALTGQGLHDAEGRVRDFRSS